MSTQTAMSPWPRHSVDADVELLHTALEIEAFEALPQRLRELAVLAGDLAAGLRVSTLSAADRERLRVRTAVLLRRRRRARLVGLPVARRNPAVLVAGAGGAAVGLVVLGLALLRRAHPVAQPA